MALDTLAIQRRLREAGIDDQQAGAITREIADAVSGEVATRQDLRELRNELQSEINQVRGEVAEVRGEVAQLRGEVAQVRGEIARLEGRVADLANEIAGLRNIMADSKVSNARWAIGLTATIALGFVGIIVALVVV